MIKDDKLTLLAEKRTELAQLRTILAFVRTATALILFGVAFIEFGRESKLLLLGGWISIGIGIMFLFFAVIHWFKHKQEMEAMKLFFRKKTKR